MQILADLHRLARPDFFKDGMFKLVSMTAIEPECPKEDTRLVASTKMHWVEAIICELSEVEKGLPVVGQPGHLQPLPVSLPRRLARFRGLVRVRLAVALGIHWGAFAVAGQGAGGVAQAFAGIVEPLADLRRVFLQRLDSGRPRLP